MKFNGLNRLTLVLASFFIFTSSIYSQKMKMEPSVWLDGGLGFCINDTYNNGAAPLALLGYGTSLQTGVMVDWGRYHLQNESRTLFGMFFDPFEGYVGCLQNGIEFLYRICDRQHDRLHLWIGGSLQGDAFIMVLPPLSSASTSNVTFGNLCAKGMVQYDFVFVPDGSYNLLTAYGKLTLPLVGVTNFPGFSYMDNYLSDINLVYTLLSTYETRCILFPGVATNLGFRFNLPNGNKVGLSYRWDYMTTRNRGQYRFDNAFHSLVMDFMFKLN